MKKFCLYSNNYNASDFESSYKEYLIVNEIDGNDFSIYDFINLETETDFSDFEGNICCNSKLKGENFVVVGSCGTWQGRREIVPTVCDSLIDAIYLATRNGETITIEQVNGHIEVSSSHHDGRNNLNIYMLNSKGYDAWGREGNADLSKKCYHKAFQAY